MNALILVLTINLYVLVWLDILTKKVNEKIKGSMNQNNLVPITFGVLMVKVRNFKNWVQNKLA